MVSQKISKKEKYISFELLGDEVNFLWKHYRKYDETIPLPIIKKIIKQLLLGLKELKQKNIYHNDIKLENMLFVKPLAQIFKTPYDVYMDNILKYVFSTWWEDCGVNYDTFCKNIRRRHDYLRELLLQDINIKIVDFGNGYNKKIASRPDSRYYYSRPTRHYISPEILLGIPHWTETDMWAVGCITYELLTAKLLFDPERDNNAGINCMHLLRMIQAFGPMPEYLINQGRKYNKYFVDGTHKFNYLCKRRATLYDCLYKNMNKKLRKKELSNVMKFLEPIFQYDKNKRITPNECLKSPWLSS
jgi:serine/threonine protein kinase